MLAKNLTRFATDNPGVPIVLIGHSQGAAHIRNTLKKCSKDVQQTIMCLIIEPAKYIPREICKDVIHITNKSGLRDPITRIDVRGRRQAKSEKTIMNVKSARGAPLFDHSLDSISYREAIEDAYGKLLDRQGIKP